MTEYSEDSSETGNSFEKWNSLYFIYWKTPINSFKYSNLIIFVGKFIHSIYSNNKMTDF